MIFCDYVLVITWLPAAMIVNERYLHNCCTWCKPKAGLARLMSGGGKQEEAAAPSPAPSAELVKAAPGTGSPSPGDSMGSLKVVVGGAPAGASTDDTGAFPRVEKMRWLEEFYGGAYADFVTGHSKVLTLFFVAFFAATVLTTALFIEPDTNQISFFEDDHFFLQSSRASGDHFGVTQTEPIEYLAYTYTVGLKTNDPWDMKDVHPCGERAAAA